MNNREELLAEELNYNNRLAFAQWWHYLKISYLFVIARTLTALVDTKLYLIALVDTKHYLRNDSIIYTSDLFKFNITVKRTIFLFCVCFFFILLYFAFGGSSFCLFLALGFLAGVSFLRQGPAGLRTLWDLLGCKWHCVLINTIYFLMASYH